MTEETKTNLKWIALKTVSILLVLALVGVIIVVIGLVVIFYSVANHATKYEKELYCHEYFYPEIINGYAVTNGNLWDCCINQDLNRAPPQGGAFDYNAMGGIENCFRFPNSVSNYDSIRRMIARVPGSDTIYFSKAANSPWVTVQVETLRASLHFELADCICDTTL